MNLKAINVAEFDACQKCTLCESFCPVLRVEPAFPGPKLAGANSARLGVMKDGYTGLKGIDYCSDCRTCNVVCPSGIKPATLIMRQRWQMKEKSRSTLRDLVLSRPDLIGALASRWPAAVNFSLKQKLIRKTTARFIGIAPARNLPAYARVNFRRWYATYRHCAGINTGRVVYFHGCYTNFNRPETGRDLVLLLEGNGIKVEVPKQNCCGLPKSLNGNMRSSRDLAAANLQHLLPYVEEGVPVIFTCPSCASMIKYYYPEVYRLPGAEKVAAASFDACEYILAVMPGLSSNGSLGPVLLKTAYHTPCHLRSQGIGTPALELLAAIPGLDIHALGNNCCGMSGTYGYKAEKYGLSLKIGAPLFREIKDYRPDMVATDCGSCMMQIEERTDYPVIHPVELVYRAWKVAGERQTTG